MGHKLPRAARRGVSALPPKADTKSQDQRVRHGPIADMGQRRIWHLFRPLEVRSNDSSALKASTSDARNVIQVTCHALFSLTFEQAIKCDRGFAHANAGGVPDRIRDCTCRAGDANLSDALDAELIDMRIVFLD